MRLDTAFRLSTYLTVAVASGCLTYAEGLYLPGIAFFALPLAALMVVAYCVEGRWALSAQGANGLGLLISVGWVGWVIFFSDEFGDPLGRPPWPAVFLPYLGPMLMVLLLVKLFRPKGIRDYWYIHSIGLIEVAVGSVLVVEPYFGTMLLGYIVCAFWSLMLFYVYREQARVRRDSRGLIAIAIPGGTPGLRLSPADDKSPWRHQGFWLASRRALAAVGVAFLLFYVTPQYGTTEAISFLSQSSQAQTGFANAPVDLRTTGQLEVNESVAFEVYVENADSTPKTNLSPSIRWRGMVMDHYSKSWGEWRYPSYGHQPTAFQRQSYKELPNLGNEQYYITFQLNTGRSGGLFLAEPIVIASIPNKDLSKAPETRLPYLSRSFENLGLFGYEKRRDLLIGIMPISPMEFSYQQVTRPVSRDGLSEAIPILTASAHPANFESRQRQVSGNQALQNSVSEDELQLSRNLLDQPVQGIHKWTSELLDQLVQQGKLEKKDLLKEPTWPKQRLVPLARASRAKVARALSDYLTFSGEYVYSLNLEPLNFTTDPAEDFLRNVKQGHCVRFATGLALMLRSAGIPCRYVVGFRGADAKNPLEPDNGWYVVRQSHAHAWVEALVGEKNPEGKMELRWLTLDPSPLREADNSGTLSLAQWWERSLQFLHSFWRIYILEYNTDQQGGVLEALWTRFALTSRAETFGSWVQREPYWLAGFTALLVGLIWLRRPKTSRRPRAVPLPETAFYHRLLTLMERRCRLVPKVGQTPQEFGARAQELLAAQKVEALLKDLPPRIVELFYKARYGGMAISPGQLQEIDRQLDFLNAVLKNGPRLAN
jgi:hypothetical protein